MPTKFLMIVTFALLASESVLAQGSAVVSPISKAVYKKDASISFYIHNRTKQPLKLNYTPVCDVDGLEVIGKKCTEYFEFTLSKPIEDGAFTIDPLMRVKGTVRIAGSVSSYALFKPIFDPGDVDKEKGGIRFVFNYQPGYLFIENPNTTRLAPPAFSTATQSKFRVAKFTFDLSKINSPQVLSVSAKIVDVKTKKTKRFLRLANEKIADPKRKVFALEGEFDVAASKDKVCYQIFMQNHSEKTDVYQMTNCKF